MPLPPCLSTCHQIRAEATAIYYQYNTFRCLIHDGFVMTPVQWIDSLSYEERQAISKVVVELVTNEQARTYEDRLSSAKNSSERRCVARETKAMEINNAERWFALSERMSSLSTSEHSKIVYEVKEERVPYREKLLRWKRFLDSVKERAVRDMDDTERSNNAEDKW